MNNTPMVSIDLIISSLSATSKKQAFRQIAEQAALLYFGNPEELLDSMMERERIGSTGIGRGVAIPHVKAPKAKRMYGIFVRLEKPIDYDAIDNEPVDLLFMLIAPSESKTTEHLKALAGISRFLKNPATCGRLRETAAEDELSAFIQEWAKSLAA